jgi:glycosyltransferase involved in cell wall biosynthesis
MATNPRQKVLYAVHNHPAIRPGGCEAYALELYEAMRDGEEFDAVFLSRSGPPMSVTARHHEGRPFTLVNDDPNQYFFYTDLSDWDWTFGRSPNKSALTRFFREFLLDQKPDVVHLQHTLFIGYDVLRVIRNTLPDVPILYTLHEFLPICFHDGKLIRTMNNEPCLEPSPRRCHECFPTISQQTFFMRERFIKSHLSLVDQFIAPSRFLLDRYVDWGIPPDRIMFFGQLTPFKGIDVLLEAMALLGEDSEAQLAIHGANLDWAPTDFQDRLRKLLADAGESVTLVGQYEPHELSKLMEDIDWVVVPSIWWENSPLVIQEAFMHGRPVICSDIGGMAEKVTDGVNGLHFRRGDADSLADAMRHAADTAGLWDRLRKGIPQVHPMPRHVATLGDIYRSLIAERRAAVTRPARVVERV